MRSAGGTFETRPSSRVARGNLTPGSHGTVHLLSALRGDGIVLAQREVDAKSNEITAFRPLLDPLDLADAVETPMHC
ncbi:hypothetical protein [Streptomyces scopuliridis]|uniref:hypothetical protein n=1 Tax=Streptomyces scopuliridis TaxID=452529 RepID=UPI0036C86E7C